MYVVKIWMLVTALYD